MNELVGSHFDRLGQVGLSAGARVQRPGYRMPIRIPEGAPELL